MEKIEDKIRNKINSRHGQNVIKAFVGGTLAYTLLNVTGLLDQGFDMINLENAGEIIKYFTTLQASRLGLWPALNSEYLNHKSLKEITNNHIKNVRETYSKINQSLEQVTEQPYVPVKAE